MTITLFTDSLGEQAAYFTHNLNGISVAMYKQKDENLKIEEYPETNENIYFMNEKKYHKLTK